jgi:TP901 family phage tail tape measure protein
MPEDAGTIYSAVMLKLDQLRAGVVKVESLMNRVVKSTKEKSSNFGSFWKNAFQTAFGFGIIGIINKMTNSVRNMLNIFTGFQQSMKNTQSVTKAVGEELRLLEESAKEAGETTRFTAREAADALYYLGSAGFSAQQSVDALNGVLQLAGATQSDLASTSATVASIISQYSLEAEDATRVSNVFAAAITNSQATMEKLSNAYRQVGPVAAGFGQTLEETTGILQELFNAGFRGQQAGRALKSAFADLASPTANMEKIFKRLNVSLEDVNPETNKFADIIDTLAESGATTSDIIDAFGKVAGPQMAVLIKEGGDALREYTEAVTDTNAAAEAYAIQNDSLAGSLDFLKSKLESTAIAIFEKLEPGMRDLIDSFIEFLDAIRPVGEALGYLLNIFFQIASISTGAVTALFDGLFKAFSKMRTPMEEVTDNMTRVRESIQEVGEIQNTANRLNKLTDEYERLSSKTDLTEKEQKKLKNVIAEIEDIAPDATTKMDDYGKAIKISGEKAREAAEQMLQARKAIIEQSKASLEATKPLLEDMLKIQSLNLKNLKEEEQRTAEINRVTRGRMAILAEMQVVFQDLQEEEVLYGKTSTGSFSRSTEGVLRYVAQLRKLGLTQFDVFAKGRGTITDVLDEIGKALNNTERDYKNYQELLNERIKVEIDVIDIQKKLSELASLESELRTIDEGLEKLGETTEETAEKTEEFESASDKFWKSYKQQIEEATREARLFGEEQDVLKQTLDFLKDAYLGLIKEGLDPSSKTLRRLRQEYDLTLIQLNALIEAEKMHDQELKDKEKAEDDVIKMTENYYKQLQELQTSEEGMIELERNRALMAVYAAGASEEATQKAVEAINLLFDKMQEKSEETKEAVKLDMEEMVTATQTLITAMIGLFNQLTENRLTELEKQMEAELEAAGLLEETERERLERELEAARAARDEELIQEKEDALARLDIEEKYEKKKAEIEYKGALVEWGLKLTGALGDLYKAIMVATASAPFPANVPAIAFAAAQGVNVGLIAAQKPEPPSFDTGGLAVGPESGYMAKLHGREVILNDDQVQNLFNAIDNGSLGNNAPVNVTAVIELDSYVIGKSVERTANSGQIRFTTEALE